MKIDIVTFSCDSSPMYTEFWNPVSKYWKTKFGVHPVLLYIGDEDISLSEEYGTVHRVPSVSGVPGYMCGCWGRFWITKKYLDKVCITGDIDMIPLSKDYFITQLKKYTDDSYVHLNSDGYYPGNFEAWKTPYNAVLGYDHVARGELFNKVYSFEDSFEQEMYKYRDTDFSKVTEYAYHPEKHLRHASKEMGGNWGQDEIYSTHLLRKYLKDGGKVVTDCGIPRSRRIDRSNWQYVTDLVPQGHYIDSHLLRPYSKYQEHIDFLMNLVP